MAEFYENQLLKTLNILPAEMPCVIYPDNIALRLDFSEFSDSKNQKEAYEIYKRIMRDEVYLDPLYIIRHVIEVKQKKFYFIVCESYAHCEQNSNFVGGLIFTLYRKREHELIKALPRNELIASYLEQCKDTETKEYPVYGPCALVPYNLLNKFKI
jgi:hypothetical protein